MGAAAQPFSCEVRHIHVDDDGVAWIEGTAVKVLEIVLDRRTHGWSPEEVHLQHPDLSLAKIYAALAWYHDHQADMDGDIERRLTVVEAMRADAAPSPFREIGEVTKDDPTAPSAESHAPPGDAPIVRRRFGQRVSKSADEAWARELSRIWAMTPEERMLEALSLDEETEELLAGIGHARR